MIKTFANEAIEQIVQTGRSKQLPASIHKRVGMRLAKYFGNSTQQWLNLQNIYDLSPLYSPDIERIQPFAC